MLTNTTEDRDGNSAAPAFDTTGAYWAGAQWTETQWVGAGLWPQPLSCSLMVFPELLPSLGDARPNFEVPKLGIPRIHPPPGMG